MGIRIRKDIGYLMTLETAPKILVPNYADILEDLEEDEQAFFDRIIKEHESYESEKNSSETMFTHIYANMFAKEKERLEVYHLIKELYMGDDSAGILFRSPELFRASRYDDLIDYYEMSIYAHDIKYLNRPIFPTEGYIYTGGLNEEHFKIQLGAVYDNYRIKYQLLEHLTFKDPDDEYGNIVNSGHFVPNVETFVYLAAKAAGILQPHVTELDFNRSVRPMIATYWS